MKRSPLKRKTPLRKRSAKKAKLDSAYTKLRKQYLEENPVCEWWLAENGFKRTKYGYLGIVSGGLPSYFDALDLIIAGVPRSTEIHHKRRPRMTYQNDVSTWMAVSRFGHNAIESNPKLAREKGYLY